MLFFCSGNYDNRERFCFCQAPFKRKKTGDFFDDDVKLQDRATSLCLKPIIKYENIFFL
jgi:hypothetical protein